MKLKNCHTILCTKKLNKFNDEIIGLKNIVSRKKEKKEIKNKVLSSAGNLYNKLYYIYKNKYNKELNSLDTKNKKKLDYKKLRLSDDLHSSEEEQEEEQEEEKDEEQEEEQKEEQEEEEQEETITDANKFNKWVNKQEAGINNKLFINYFKFQKPSDMFKNLYQINDKEKNNKLVNMINSGLKGFLKK